MERKHFITRVVMVSGEARREKGLFSRHRAAWRLGTLTPRACRAAGKPPALQSPSHGHRGLWLPPGTEATHGCQPHEALRQVQASQPPEASGAVAPSGSGVRSASPCSEQRSLALSCAIATWSVVLTVCKEHVR